MGSSPRLRSAQDAVDVRSCAAVLPRQTVAVGDKPASPGVETARINRRQAITLRKSDDQLRMDACSGVGQHHQAAEGFCGKSRDLPLDVFLVVNAGHLRPDTESGGILLKCR